MPTVTAVILARNEERRIPAAIRSVRWCLEVLVLDDGSTDRTAEIARELGARVIPVKDRPPGPAFDALRNQAIPEARGEWILFVDADERIPERLGPVLLELLERQGQEFSAVALPFVHRMFGRSMRFCGLYPGYSRPQLLKKGRFQYNERVHSGVAVDGPEARFETGDPDLFIVHEAL